LTEESPVVRPFSEVASELADPVRPLLNATLVELSGISPEEQAHLAQVWPGITLARRREIISRLVDLAEDNFELDFEDVFRLGLGDEDADIRSQSITGLWEEEDPCLISPLLNLLEHDSSEAVRAAAATALGKFIMLGEHQKLRASYTDRICRSLLPILSDSQEPPEIRRRALEAIAPCNSPKVEIIIREAYGSRNHKLKASAIYAMGRTVDPVWLPLLVREMNNPDAEIRYEAAVACGEIGDEAAVSPLIELIEDSDIEVSLAAIRALGQIGGEEANDYLEEQLEDTSLSPAFQEAIEQALAEIRENEEPLGFPF
jgi:HEAT repeat protein